MNFCTIRIVNGQNAAGLIAFIFAMNNVAIFKDNI